MKAEQWRSVVGYEGLYEVSDLGHVWSIRSEVMLSSTVKSSGAATLSLYRPEKRTVKVAYLVLEAFVGPRPLGLVACHWDDNPANNRLSNLRWDTQAANHADRLRNRGNQCSRGHEFSGGRGYCRECRNMKQRQWRQEKQMSQMTHLKTSAVAS